MSDSVSNDPTMNEPAQGFCAQCGRVLAAGQARAVGNALYCEPCLAAHVQGAAANSVPPPPGYRPVGSAAYAGAAGYGSPAPFSGQANPVVAGVLGAIPGVGAMYNGQYAKGVVHLVVFAVLVSLSNSNGIFGLFVAGWVCYMAIEAYHTARARRDRQPLPNPFGLNDIGERLGFGRNWAATSPAGAGAAAGSGGEPFTAVPDPTANPVAGAQPWGAPSDSFAGVPGSAGGYASAASSAGWSAPAGASYPPGSTAAASDAGRPGFGAGYGGVYDGGVSGYGMPLGCASPGRFPAGAVWLIGLGTVFLLSTSGLFRNFRGGVVAAIFLIGLGAYIFSRRLAETSASAPYDDPAFHRFRVVRALRGGLFLVLVGVLMLLNDFDILRWHNSWPLFLIAFGVLALVEHGAVGARPVPYAAPAYPAPPSQPGSMLAVNDRTPATGASAEDERL